MGLILPPPNSRVYIDTQFSIYVMQFNAVYARRCDAILAECRSAGAFVHSSELTVHECLVQPLRNQDQLLRQRYEHYFKSGRVNFDPIVRSVLINAAQIRAVHRPIKAPDAIHIATAQAQGCETILSNDKAWAGCTSAQLQILNELLGQHREFATE